MLTLEERLDWLDSSLVQTICMFWCGRKAPGGKAACIAALLPVLQDPEGIYAQTRRWDEDFRLALAVTRALGSASYADHLAACAAAGVDDGESCIRGLLERGVLLPSVAGRGNKVTVKQLSEEWARELAVLPSVGHVAEQGKRPLLTKAIHPDRVLATRTADPGVLAAAVLRVATLCGRRRLRLNQDGLPGGPLLAALAKEVGEGGLFALMVAMSGGMVLSDEGDLYPEPKPMGDPSLEALVRTWFDGFLRAATWRDDGPELDADALDALRTDGWGRPTLRDHARARRVLAGVLRRLDVDGWVPVDAIVDAALRGDELLLWRCVGGWSHDRRAPSTASERRADRDTCAAVIARTFHAFGLVDVGSLDATIATPRHRAADHVLDAAFRDDRRARYDQEERKKPAWRPAPTPLLVRLTPFGRAVLRGEADTAGGRERSNAVSRGVHVGADFEIVAHRRDLQPGLLFRLDAAAVCLPTATGDPVRRWRVERERWIAALDGGLDGEALLASLGDACDRPIPDSVRATLAGWSAQFGQTTLYTGFDLIEFVGGIDVPGAVVVGPGLALVPPRAVAGTLFDYSRPRLPFLDVLDDGRLRVDESTVGLLLLRELQNIAVEDAASHWRLDPAKVRAHGSEAVARTLAGLSKAPLTPGFRVRLRAWAGEVQARVETVEVVHVAEAAPLAQLPEIAPHIRGALGPTALIVAPRARKGLLRALAGLGVVVMEG